MTARAPRATARPPLTGLGSSTGKRDRQTPRHVIAPDYPGFGHSAVPDRADFAYTFDHLAEITGQLLDQLGVGRFALYVMDFGAPIGFRLVLRHPERLTALVAQNAPLYPEEPRGWWATLGEYWADGSAEHREASRAYLELEGIQAQYLFGVKDPRWWTLTTGPLTPP